MKHFVMRSPRNTFSVESIKQLDKQVETCDWVAAYQTTGGTIARLVSYRRNGAAWEAGFKYINGNSTTHRCKNELYFSAWNHEEAIKNALENGRDVLLFESEFDFIHWYNQNKRSHC